MTHWVVNDLVDVRANSGQAWSPGTVTAVDAQCYKVTLTTPISANSWLGITRKHAGTELVNVVTVMKHCDNLVPDKHIRTQGG